MFTTRELTGEVDHSFFDSDCENGGFVKDGKKMGDTYAESDHSAEGDWRSPPSSRHHHAINGQSAESLDPGGSREAGGKDRRYGSELKPISQTSSISSIDRHLAKLIRNDSDDDEVSSVTSERRPNETLEVEYKETDDDDDGYHQSQDESEEEERLPPSRRHSGQNGGNLGTPKKLLRKRHPRVPSPASSDAGTDTEADRFSVSSHESCSLEHSSLTSPKASRPSSPPRVRNPGACSGCRHRPQTPSESDTVTNVTPLSTPDLSPHRSVDLSPGRDVDKSETENVKDRQKVRRQERVPSSASTNIQQRDKDYDDNLNEHSAGSETQLEGPLFFDVPPSSSRKNFSFRNDEVRSIDRENRRLLRELSRQSSRSAASSAARGMINKPNNPPPIRLYHSAVNRQREQQRIEKENLAFLKRLESVKPTPGLRRLDQLAEYQRQAAYMGASHIIYATTPERERPTTRTPIGKCPSLTSVSSNNSGRVTHDSSNQHSNTASPGTRGKKPGVTRPAWVS